MHEINLDALSGARSLIRSNDDPPGRAVSEVGGGQSGRPPLFLLGMWTARREEGGREGGKVKEREIASVRNEERARLLTSYRMRARSQACGKSDSRETERELPTLLTPPNEIGRLLLRAGRGQSD